MTEPTEESEFYFQSIGALTGQYFPSEDDLAVGTLMSELGIFPANLRPSVQNFIENCPWVLTRSVRYLCWLKQIDTEPYYLLTLMKCPKKYPDWVQGSGWFNLQGLIEEVRVKEIVLLVQRNYKSRPTEEQLANSRTYIRFTIVRKGSGKGNFGGLRSCYSRENLIISTVIALLMLEKLRKCWHRERRCFSREGEAKIDA